VRIQTSFELALDDDFDLDGNLHETLSENGNIFAYSETIFGFSNQFVSKIVTDLIYVSILLL